VKASRRSLAEASSVNRRLARAYESLERSLRSASSSSSAATAPPTAAAATLPPSPSDDGAKATAAGPTTTTTPSTTATTTPEHSPVAGGGAAATDENAAAAATDNGGRGGGGGRGGFATPPRGAPDAGPESPVGALLGGDGWREARLGSGSGGGGALEDRRRQSSATAATATIQVRNLSTGDVGVLDTSGEMSRGRASTEGGSSMGDRVSLFCGLGCPAEQTLALVSTARRIRAWGREGMDVFRPLHPQRRACSCLRSFPMRVKVW